jgi:putative NADPH-quinone reductase
LILRKSFPIAVALRGRPYAGEKYFSCIPAHLLISPSEEARGARSFHHPSGGGPLITRLTHVNALWVVSSTGAPWWVTRLYMGDPVRRQIARGIMPLVGRKASFRMLTLYDMDRMTEQRAGTFLDRLEQAFRHF